jgi:60 kDa SS-A/Ro ribonucleoprotein
MSYLSKHRTRRVPQWLPLAGQVANSAGGHAWAVDIWMRLRRFLILGSEDGSYYASEWALTPENAQAVEHAVREDGQRAVAEIVRVSAEGRAPKNDPALYALAYAAGAGDVETRRAALAALPQVARTGTHLFQFAAFVEGFRGWGRALRRAVGQWYTARPVDALAYQAVKYRQREGFTHRDVLRLAHPARLVSAGNPTLDISTEQARLFEWIVRGGEADRLPRIVEGYTRAQRAGSADEAARLVREYQLPREALPSEHLTSSAVWEALLETMPMTAMIRNLATMTRVGLLTPGSPSVRVITERLSDGARIRKARVHPIALLVAARTYASGRGVRGHGSWAPVTAIVDALDEAFYLAFGNVQPTGKRLLLALDVSGSMTFGSIAGMSGLTPRDASAAMALVTLAVERHVEVVGFHAGRGGWVARRRGRFQGRADALTPLPLSARQRLDDAVRRVSDLPFGGTDCALPMRFALEQGRAVDTFVIYTDSETWAGDMHPAEALRRYRQSTGIAARLVVVGMVVNRFTIADPNDAGMLDVVGFDTSTPQVIGGFARGEL